MTAPGGVDRSQTAVRDHLANERTFLAWVRTAVTFIGLGFAVDRLLVTDALGHLLGLAMIVIGGGMMVPALVSFRRTVGAIEQGGYAPPRSTATILAFVVIGGAAALVAYVLLRGP
ncbi:MAG: YidH family protein [Candidatus Limnocylindria bacterium]